MLHKASCFYTTINTCNALCGFALALSLSLSLHLIQRVVLVIIAGSKESINIFGFIGDAQLMSKEFEYFKSLNVCVAYQDLKKTQNYFMFFLVVVLIVTFLVLLLL